MKFVFFFIFFFLMSILFELRILEEENKTNKPK